MKKKKELERIVLASLLTAISIVIEIGFKQITFIDQQFGFPYFALPLIIGSLVLGPTYGGIMGAISDIVGFYAVPQKYSFDPAFTVSAIAWGVLPYFIAKYKDGWFKTSLAVFITHLAATTLNSFAIWYSTGDANTFFASLWIRLIMLPINVVILSFLTYRINKRLEVVFDDYQYIKKPKEKDIELNNYE